MLGKLQALGLVVGTEISAVKRLRPLQHVLIDQPADDLSMLENEGDLVAAHLKHGAAARTACRRVAKAGIEETGIVDAKLADQRVERRHFGGIKRRHMHCLPRNENVELVRIEDDVTIYAEATILGDVTIGKGAIIGGNVWVKQSVPAGFTVATPSANLVCRTPKVEGGTYEI